MKLGSTIAAMLVISCFVLSESQAKDTSIKLKLREQALAMGKKLIIIDENFPLISMKGMDLPPGAYASFSLVLKHNDGEVNDRPSLEWNTNSPTGYIGDRGPLGGISYIDPVNGLQPLVGTLFYEAFNSSSTWPWKRVPPRNCELLASVGLFLPRNWKPAEHLGNSRIRLEEWLGILQNKGEYDFNIDYKAQRYVVRTQAISNQ